MGAPLEWTTELVEGSTVVGNLEKSPDLSVTWALDDAGTASFSLPPGNPVKQLIKPLITDLRVKYRGEPLWRGRITGRNRSIDDTTATAKWTAIDYRGLLGRRKVWTDLTWSTTPAQAAWSLISQAQSRTGPGWNLGVASGPWFPFNPTRNLTAEHGEWIADAVGRFAGQHPGFDWWIDGDLRFQAAPWRGQTEIAWGLYWGGTSTLSELIEDFDSAGYANHMHSTGAEGVTRWQQGAADLPFDPPRPEGRWEDLVANTNHTTATQVAAAGERALARRSTLAPAYKAKVIPGAWSPERAWVGDVVKIQSRHPEMLVDTADRISAITVTVDPDGPDPTVDITCGTSFVEDLAVMLGRVPRRLVDLDRR